MELLQQKAPQKREWKTNIETRIISFHEKQLRHRALNISQMKYFNISTLGLSGNKCHPAISGINTANDVKRSRFHLKMLLGDLYTYKTKSEQSGGDPNCILCIKYNPEPVFQVEDILHILMKCNSFNSIRENYFNQYEILFQTTDFEIDKVMKDQEEMCQFILDCTSLNLKRRLHCQDQQIDDVFKISRNLRNDINVKRLQLLGCRRNI